MYNVKQALFSLPLLPHLRPRPLLFPQMYIPFASPLGLRAALDRLVHKQPAPEAAFIDGVDFVDPRLGGGSLLDHDSGELGGPLNVSLPPLFSPLRSADHHRRPPPPPRRFTPCPTENRSNLGHHFREELWVGSRGWWLCALCERYRIVSCRRAYGQMCFIPLIPVQQKGMFRGPPGGAANGQLGRW